MGAKDNEEIIELTDVIEEGDLAQPSDTGEKDFPPEQAIDPRALEDEFEQLLQGSQDTVTGADLDNDLDIESLFDDLEKDTPSPSPDDNSSETDAQDQEVDLRGLSGNEDLPELDDLFNALDEPETPFRPEETTADEFPTPDLADIPEQTPVLEPEEPSFQETDLQPSISPEATLLEDAPLPENSIADLEMRIAALEAKSAEPDQEALFSALSAFFEGTQGQELITGITEAVSKEAQETARSLVEEKLASMDVPSSEEITSMVKEEIDAAVAENTPQPPDTDTLIAGIREELQQKVQAGMDAWEAERMALSQAMEAMREAQPQPLDTDALIAGVREELQQKVQAGMDAWEAERMALSQAVEAMGEAQPKDLSSIQELIDQRTSDLVTTKDIAGLQADLEATLAREIPTAAARVIREEIAGLLKK